MSYLTSLAAVRKQFPSPLQKPARTQVHNRCSRCGGSGWVEVYASKRALDGEWQPCPKCNKPRQ